MSAEPAQGRYRARVRRRDGSVAYESVMQMSYCAARITARAVLHMKEQDGACRAEVVHATTGEAEALV